MNMVEQMKLVWSLEINSLWWNLHQCNQYLDSKNCCYVITLRGCLSCSMQMIQHTLYCAYHRPCLLFLFLTKHASLALFVIIFLNLNFPLANPRNLGQSLCCCELSFSPSYLYRGSENWKPTFPSHSLSSSPKLYINIYLHCKFNHAIPYIFLLQFPCV